MVPPSEYEPVEPRPRRIHQLQVRGEALGRGVDDGHQVDEEDALHHQEVGQGEIEGESAYLEAEGAGVIAVEEGRVGHEVGALELGIQHALCTY